MLSYARASYPNSQRRFYIGDANLGGLSSFVAGNREPGIDRNRSLRYRDKLSAEQIQLLNYVLADELSELGYMEPGAPTPPPPLSIQLQAARGYARLLVGRRVRRMGTLVGVGNTA